MINRFYKDWANTASREVLEQMISRIEDGRSLYSLSDEEVQYVLQVLLERQMGICKEPYGT